MLTLLPSSREEEFYFCAFHVHRILMIIHVYFISALLFTALAAMSEIPALYAQRPIVLRHQYAAFYHPFVEALALTLVDIPITLVTLIIFSIILYFMTGLQRSAVSGYISCFALLMYAYRINSCTRTYI